MLSCMAVLDGVSGGCVHVNGIFHTNQTLLWYLLLISKEVQPCASSAEEDCLTDLKDFAVCNAFFKFNQTKL